MAMSLDELERLCTLLYTSPNSQERSLAESSLSYFASDPASASQCRYLIENSQNPYAQLLAASSLTKLITEQWGSAFTNESRRDLRNFLLNALAQKQFAPFVTTGIVQLICRITKLGWFEDDVHRQLVEDAARFFQASPEHCAIGLQIFQTLIGEMNSASPSTGRTLTQNRKTAVSFRDASLLSIFTMCLRTLQQLVSRAVPVSERGMEERLKQQGVQVALNCLSFDFVGTCADESADDVGCIQVPNAWRGAVSDPATLQLFFDLYASCCGPGSPPSPAASPAPAAPAEGSVAPSGAGALEALVLLASVRRSLFANERDRQQFLARLVAGATEIMRHRRGLADPATHPVFARLLARMKATNQLADLVALEGYRAFMELATAFTVETLRAWQWAGNSTHYVLSFWQRMVASMPYTKGDSPALLERYAPEIASAYVTTRLESVRACAADESLDDPLENDEGVTEQLEALPTLARYQYPANCTLLASLFNPLYNQYSSLFSRGADPSVQRELAVVEGEVTWLVYIIGAVVGGRVSASSSEEHEVLDGELASLVFQLMQASASVAQTGRQGPSTQRLEAAYVYFLQQFRKVYVGENAMASSKVYTRLQERCGLADHLALLNLLLNKIAANLRVWAGAVEIVGRTLALFSDLATGYSSGKTLLKLDAVAYMLTNHDRREFPFLEVPANTRHRTTFYATLARLLFLDEALAYPKFHAFMAPFAAVFQQLAAEQAAARTPLPSYLRSNPPARAAMVGLLRDLRGVVSATTSRRAYGLFFDWMYPTYTPALLAACEALHDDPAGASPLLKFAAEFAFNKSQRLAFEACSPNGILLFRELSALLSAYGARALAAQAAPRDLYAERYKGIALSMLILTRALGGGYVNFAVFALYNDPALQRALDVVLKMALSVPPADVLAFPKLARSYFALMEMLCHNHAPEVAALPTPTFLRLLSSLHDGLKSLDTAISAQCATALDHLFSFHFNGLAAAHAPCAPPSAAPAIAAARRIQEHLGAAPETLGLLCGTLLSTVLFEDASHQWSISRPLLPLLLLNEPFLAEYRQQLVASLPADRAERLLAAFERLMADVGPSLEARNRDRFTQNLTLFRHDFRARLTS